jgi:hypothetical protein
MYKIKGMSERVCICDRCGRVIRTSDYVEDQERISIDFTAGYGSVFGDGNRVQADLCQHCVRKVLGRWLRVTEPTPQEPHRAYQPYQDPDGCRCRCRSSIRTLLSNLENNG